MEDHAQLLRGGERSGIRVIKTRALPRTPEPSSKWSTVISACLVCGFFSFIFGVNVGHAWRKEAPAPLGLSISGGTASTTNTTDAANATNATFPANQTDVVNTSSSYSTPSPTLVMGAASSGASWTTTAGTPCITASPTPASVRMTKPRRKTIVTLGDSITMYASDPGSQGYGLRLAGEYVRGADVLNRGVTVYNTKGFLTAAIPVLEDEIATWLSPDVITVWFGVNDATVVGGQYQGQHVPVENYKQNLITMLQRLHKAAPSAKLILMTPMTVDDSRRLPTNRNNEQTGIYAAACREVMDHVEGVTLLDMYKYMMETYPNPADRGKLQVDGLHLNTEGHRVTYELLKKEIEKLLPHFSSRTQQVPEWESLHDKYPANIKL